MGRYSKRDRQRCRFLLRTLDIGRPLNICDVGARMQTTPPYQLLHQSGGAHVWGFEPDEGAFAKIREAAPPNATYLQKAVGKPGPAVFRRHPIGSLSSIFPIAEASARFLGKFHWNGRDVQEIPMTLVGLDEVADLPQIDLLKIDIQGGELDVFRSGHAKLSDAVAIIPEVRFYRMYEGEPMWRDIDAELARMGFVLHKFLHMKSVTLPSPRGKSLPTGSINNQLLDGDAVYIRSLEKMDDVSDTQLKLLALVADTVVVSFDLALMCLTELRRRGVLTPSDIRRYFDLLPDHLKPDAKLAAAE